MKSKVKVTKKILNEVLTIISKFDDKSYIEAEDKQIKKNLEATHWINPLEGKEEYATRITDNNEREKTQKAMGEYEWNYQQIKDLLDSTDRKRSIGRTTIMIRVFLDIAKENPNAYIPIWDHHPTINQHRNFDYFRDAIAREMAIRNTKELEEHSNYYYTFIGGSIDNSSFTPGYEHITYKRDIGLLRKGKYEI